MKVDKNRRQIEKINKLKEEFNHLSSEVIASRLANFSGSNPISIANKQILNKRGIDDFLTFVAINERGGWFFILFSLVLVSL
jgi:hypothetical protein